MATNLYIENYNPEVSQAGGIKTKKNIVLAAGAMMIGQKEAVAASGGTTRTLLATNSGSMNLFDSAAGITYTLPAPVAGLQFDFATTVLQTSSAHVVVTDAATTFLLGSIAMFSGNDVTPSSTLGPKMYLADGTSFLRYTSNGTTTGGGIGTWLRFTCISSTQWFVNGVVKSPSGTLATPFST